LLVYLVWKTCMLLNKETGWVTRLEKAGKILLSVWEGLHVTYPLSLPRNRVKLMPGFSFPEFYSCSILTTEPFSARNPLSSFTVGALKVTVAPLWMITPVPIIREVAPTHSHTVPV